MLDRRLAGVLLHPTSLPGPYGIGDLGPAAHAFVDWLTDAGLACWQVLPLGPTGYGDSPYQCFSASAGNPMLVSPQLLVAEGLLVSDEVTPPAFPVRVDYGWVIDWKTKLLRRAHERLVEGQARLLRERFEAWSGRADVAGWLEDYALFMACKDEHGGQPWNTWERELRNFKPSAMKKARKALAPGIAFHRFAQFLFFDQWKQVRDLCRMRNVRIIGDAPIYVAYDSADTWAHQDLFLLDADGLPTEVAGVPPDYFSETGQLWGNPLYRWERMAEDGYAWWIERMRNTLALVDIVRLDHFRGFMGYWSVPFGDATAENGGWVKGPGEELFAVLRGALGELPIIAEDLGDITSDVNEARNRLGLPGMKVLQFAWTPASVEPLVPNPNSGFLPHQHETHTVVYTGTHDNDTTLGWWQNAASSDERTCLQVYLSTDGNAANWDLIRAAFGSVADTAIVPMQDYLGLGSEGRMNSPGRAEGNWSWRMSEGQLTSSLARHVRQSTLMYHRCADPPAAAKPVPPKDPEY